MEDIIEIAEEDDLPEILALQKRAFMEVARLLGRYDLPPLTQTLEETRKEAADNIILKYVSNGRIAGTVRGRMLGNGNCLAGKLSVDPRLQGKGIGRKLMSALESYFPDCKAYELFTSPETPNTVHLYSSLGYEFSGNIEMGGMTMVRMQKQNKKTNI